jgi:hypothetical protein
LWYVAQTYNERLLKRRGRYKFIALSDGVGSK